MALDEKPRLLVEPLYGFGDHLYLRPIVLATTETYDVYIKTAYPELYQGTSVKCVHPGDNNYSFSDQNGKVDKGWVAAPSKPYKYIRNIYTVEQLRSGMTVSSIISQGFPRANFSTRLSVSLDQWHKAHDLVNATRPICLVKMPSHASDWKPTARTPKLDYLIECLKVAKSRDFHIVSIKGENDTWDEPERVAEWDHLVDTRLYSGLSIDELIGMVGIAHHVVSSPNFTIPLCISTETPLFTVFGGHVEPGRLVDPRMNAYKWRYVAPSPFCNCVKNQHDCNKEIAVTKVVGEYADFLTNNFSNTLLWDEAEGYGFYPVDNRGVYNDAYFNKYVGYEQSDFGVRLNAERVKLAKLYANGSGILDVGIGSGQFVRSVDGFGYDVCHKAVEYLKGESRWKNPWTDDLWGIDTVTFFDSFEHEEDIDGLLRHLQGRTIIISIPIFRDKAHVLASKHYRPDEHFHYFTREGLIKWFLRREYQLVWEGDFETRLGREDILTFVFEPRPLTLEKVVLGED